MRRIFFLTFLLPILLFLVLSLHKEAENGLDLYLTDQAKIVLEGKHFKVYRSFYPLVETHLVAFPLDEKGNVYKNIFDFTERSTPEQKQTYVKAIAAAAEKENIVNQGYRIVSNSDYRSLYLTQNSSHVLHADISYKNFERMLDNNHIQAFCFHIVSDSKTLSATTVTPYSLKNQQDKRLADAGYKGPQIYTECAISRIARESSTSIDILYEDSARFKSFKDHNPQALFHALVVTKESYFSHYDFFKKAEAAVVQELFEMFVRTGKHSRSGEFRITSNHGLAAHQDQPVTHFHVLADEPLGAFCYPHDVYYNKLSTDLIIHSHKDGAYERSQIPKSSFVFKLCPDNPLYMDFAASAAFLGSLISKL